MIFILFFIVLTRAQPPLCTWACDTPVCNAVCTAIATPPRCTSQCVVPPGDPEPFCYAPSCWTTCPSAVEMNVTTCPACETRCSPLQCIPTSASCTIQCEPVSAYWSCQKNLSCPQPTCQQVCESYTCQQPSSASVVYVAIFLSLLALLV